MSLGEDQIQHQTQHQLQKSKVVPGNNTYAGTLREGTKSLLIGDSHIRRVKRDKRNLLLDILVVLKHRIYIIT